MSVNPEDMRRLEAVQAANRLIQLSPHWKHFLTTKRYAPGGEREKARRLKQAQRLATKREA